MDYLLVGIVALAASALTFFSGFGLGTLLMPAFALFFPVEAAVAMTAVVHLANNLFKLVLVGRAAKLGVVLRFGVPAIGAALVGAWLLTRLAELPDLATYELLGRVCVVTPVKLAIAVLMIVFSIWELAPTAERLTLSRRWLPVGGVLSGFLGGLSGHQGALRSVFLLRAGLDKTAFIATGVTIACIIDVSRLAVYAGDWRELIPADAGWLMLAAVLAAFVGALVGRQLLHKLTLRTVQWFVGIGLMLISLGIGAGLL